MEGKDKSLIWEDCAQCAYKHLTAAYAALTSVTGPRYVPAHRVYLARAQIAIREAEAGYVGNRDLAVGCLAMAETLGYDEDNLTFSGGAHIRELRLELTSGGTSRFFVPCVGADAYAGAHFIEALRELPELASRIYVRDLLGDGGFTCDNPIAFREDLVKLIKWLKDTYEIGKGSYGDKETSAS